MRRNDTTTCSRTILRLCKLPKACENCLNHAGKFFRDVAEGEVFFGFVGALGPVSGEGVFPMCLCVGVVGRGDGWEGGGRPDALKTTHANEYLMYSKPRIARNQSIST